MIKKICPLIISIIVLIACTDQKVFAQQKPEKVQQVDTNYLGEPLPVSSYNLIPRNSTYHSNVNGLLLVVRVKSHTKKMVKAEFELRDSNHRIVSKWKVKIKNEDTSESETDSEEDNDDPFSVSYDFPVSVFRCSQPFWTELRIPFEDPSWIRAYIEHPKLLVLDKDGHPKDLTLVLQKPSGSGK